MIGQRTPCLRMADILVVGGGIAGLWMADFALSVGLSVVLVDAGPIPGAASGGLLGALMPHMPDQWNAKKQFQFDALVDLQARLKGLEEQTGLATGYRRSGRLIPLKNAHQRALALARQEEARRRWVGGDWRYEWEVLLPEAARRAGISPAASPCGVIRDTLSALVAPRLLLHALNARLTAGARFERLAGRRVVSIMPQTSRAVLDDRSAVAFGHAVVAAGVASFDMLSRLPGLEGLSLGSPVKGQAARLVPAAGASGGRLSPDAEIVYDDGVYIVAHADGSVAVGSTSERRFEAGDTTDARLDDLISDARMLCPVLSDMVVAERWAGLRPRAVGRDPMVGPMPDLDNVIALTGGFKISFGIAHRMAEAALSLVTGKKGPALPESFLPAHHVARARQAADRLEKG